MTIDEAARYVGVPPAQLIRWAGWRLEGHEVGPDFVGHPLNPKSMHYTPEALDAWLKLKRESNAA